MAQDRVASAGSCYPCPYGALRSRRHRLGRRGRQLLGAGQAWGKLTGPNPTDRSQPGTKYHVVVSTDSLPLAVMPSAADVHDTMLFPDLLRLAQVVCAAICELYADAG
ncbi:transposase [Azospirillum sp. B506]|uniref:transposase n=1 Tax=Azospirillum sp. B506 TaxID=137721 RepID=UPI0035D3F13A